MSAKKVKIGREEFIRSLFERFPEVQEAIADYAVGFLHIEMANFRRVVETAMDKGMLWEVENYLRFVDKCLDIAGPELENAIEVSFLEDFALGDFTAERYRAVKERMSKRLHAKIVEADEKWR